MHIRQLNLANREDLIIAALPGTRGQENGQPHLTIVFQIVSVLPRSDGH